MCELPSWNVLCQEWRNKNVKLVTYKWSISCPRMTWPCKETYVASVALSWYCLSIPIEYSTDRRESVNSKSVFIYHIDYASVTSSRSINLMVGTQKRSDIFNNYISVRHLLPGHQFENVSRQPCNQIYLVTTRAALHTKIIEDYGIWCDIGRFYPYTSGFCHCTTLMCSYCYTASEFVNQLWRL